MKATPHLIKALIERDEDLLWIMGDKMDDVTRRRLEDELVMLRENFIKAMLPSEKER